MSDAKICLNCKYSRIDFDCGEPLEPTCWAPENTEISLITGELLQKGERLCSTQRDPESSSIRCSKDGRWFQPITPLELADVTGVIKESFDEAAIVGRKLVQDIFSLWS
jgi:hypothetical protein